jgi:sugar lactone lactonase YvrE
VVIDGAQVYFADSPTRTITNELIEPEGLLSTPRLFAETPEGAFPDGAALDVDGCRPGVQGLPETEYRR